MASQDRFGYKWKNAPEIPPEQYIQFRRWLDLDDFSIFKNKKILDAGCGNSTNAFIVLQNGAKKVVAVDAFENTLKISRANLKCFGNRADVKFLDLEKADNYPGKYDIVLCIGVLHHLENQRKVLEKLLSTKRKNGKLFVWIYGKYNHVGIINAMDTLRKMTSVFPMSLNRVLARFISIPSFFLVKIIPGKYFKQLSGFRYTQLNTIILDQMLPSVATYYTEPQVKKLIRGLKLKYKKDRNEVGWLIYN
jgi:SAM-dependent methyltransferase